MEKRPSRAVRPISQRTIRHAHLAGQRWQYTQQGTEQRGFAAAIGAEQAERTSKLKGERNPFTYRTLPVADGQGARFEQTHDERPLLANR